MSDTVRLIGTEDIIRAARSISDSADQMQRVQGWDAEQMAVHRAFMNDWLNRFEQILRDAPPTYPNTGPR